MTLSEFQPYVEAAIGAVEWNVARLRRVAALDDERIAIEHALPLAGRYGVEAEPLQARLAQIEIERAQDVTADMVPQHPIRSVPMDLITVAVVRRLLRLPAEFPILSLKTLPNDDDIQQAVASIAMRWQSPHAQIVTDV